MGQRGSIFKFKQLEDNMKNVDTQNTDSGTKIKIKNLSFLAIAGINFNPAPVS
jgi:hypothetical protein